MLQILLQINPNIQTPASPILDHVFAFLTLMAPLIATLYGLYLWGVKQIEASIIKAKEKALNSERLKAMEIDVKAMEVELELVKKQRDADNMLLQRLLEDFDENKEQIFGLIRDIKEYSKEQIKLMIELVKSK